MLCISSEHNLSLQYTQGVRKEASGALVSRMAEQGLHLQDGQLRAVAKSDILQLNAIPLLAVHQLHSIRSVPYLHQKLYLLQVC